MDTQNTQNYHIEDNKEVAQTYINTIEERLGGKLNLETLEVEKHQTEFKDGDILSIQEDEEYYHTILIFKGGADVYVYFDCFHRVLTYGTKVDENEKSIYHLATEEEKQQLFEALAKENKAWDNKKKEVVDLRPKCEFKPFDRCIWKIRNCEGSIWQASFVSYVDEYGATPMGMSIDDDLVNLQLSLNAQEIINISKLRLCNKASKETREIWYKVIDELAQIEPYLASACVPQCVYRGFCPEPKSCGRTETNFFSFTRKHYKKLELYEAK